MTPLVYGILIGLLVIVSMTFYKLSKRKKVNHNPRCLRNNSRQHVGEVRVVLSDDEIAATDSVSGLEQFVVDMSEGGAQIFSDKCLTVGGVHFTKFIFKEADKKFESKSEIMWIKKSGLGVNLYMVGIRFLNNKYEH